MLVVRATARPSSLHNIGLFADEKIPKGTIVWKYDQRFDISFTPEEFAHFNKLQQDFLDYWAYQSFKSGNYVLSVDDSRFTNHSNNNNLDDVELPGVAETASVANRDIEPGEELLENYRLFDSYEAGSDAAFLNG